MAEPSRRPVARVVSKHITAPVRVWLVQSVASISHARPAFRKLALRLVVAHWHFLALAVARGTKVGAAMHRLIHLAYQRVSPAAGTYLGDLVVRFLFELGFKQCLFFLRFGQLHAKFLRFEFDAVQRLHLGETHV